MRYSIKQIYRCKNGCNVRGFTLIELLVVISIIAMLLSILMPALGKVKEQARRIVCGAHIKQLGLIWMLYAEDNKQTLPPSYLGGSWNYLYDFTHDALAAYGVENGELFYCPSYVFSDADGDGTLDDWEHPRSGLGRDLYPVGYDLFTNVIVPSRGNDPLHRLAYPWLHPDGVEAPISWHYSYTHADVNLQNLVPATRITDTSHTVNAGSGVVSVRIRPAATPMAFDTAYSYDDEFTRESCRHRRGGDECSGINAVYLDGHVEWRGWNSMGILRDMGTGSDGTNHKRWY